MPIRSEAEIAEEDGVEAGELAGAVVYEALVDQVAETAAGLVMGLVSHVQQGTPWERLPLQLRELCAELEDRIVEVDDEEG